MSKIKDNKIKYVYLLRKDQDIFFKQFIDDKECIKILMNAAKQLKDSIKQYLNANREDLAEKETYELSLLQNYLPELMNEEDIGKEILIIINDNNAKSISNMGKIMGSLKQKYSDSIDFAKVNTILKGLLS